MHESIKNKLLSMKINLPAPSAVAGSYCAVKVVDRFAYVSGQLSFGEDGSLIKGFVGDDVSLETGQDAAQWCALHILSQLDAYLASNPSYSFHSMISIHGFVSCRAGFTDHPEVINGASDFLLKVLGEAGVHTRIAVGVASLPRGAAVEIAANACLEKG